VAGALYAAWRGLLRPGVLPSAGLGLAVGLGLLTKGPLAVAAPFLVAVAWLLTGVRVKPVLRVAFSPWAWIVALAVAAPWYVLVERAQPGWIQHFITYEHFGRFAEGDHRDFHPFWFYVPIALLYLVPWTAITWVRGGHEGGRRVLGLLTGSPWSLRPWRPALPMQYPIGRGGSSVTSGRLAWGWFLILFLLYTLSTRKLLNYLLPAALPLFVLAGSRLTWLLDRGRRLPFVLPVLVGVAAVVGGALVQTDKWFPLATGGTPDAHEASRWAGLGPWMIAAGLALLVATFAASRVRKSPRVRGVLLVIGAALFWWGLDAGLAHVSDLGSSRRIAAALVEQERAGRIPVTLKRYPQGIRFYEDVHVWIAGGTPDKWRQREIVNPYAKRAWKLRRGLLTDEEFERLWRSELAVALVCRKGEIDLLDAHVIDGPFAGAGRTDLYLVGNHPPGDE
jgi:4-amino-4-deoxy-L-arabinose transferase-like glycosyltransferase